MTNQIDTRKAPTKPAVARGGRRQRARVVLSIVSGAVQFVLVVGLIGSGVYAAYWFNSTSGTSQKSESTRDEASRLVEITQVQRATASVTIRAMGTVMAARDVTIRPRVTGMIVDQADMFVPGGFFREGEFMAQIDRADYDQSLRQAQTELDRAEAALQIELGDQAVAREELELLEVDIPAINRDLILRIPQVNRAKADVRSAEAAIERADLSLARTRIIAPFDGQVITRAAAVGNNVSAGDALATFVGTEEYWIELAVPVSSLRWIEFPTESDSGGSVARVRYPQAWGADAEREGVVARRIGRLERGSRLARVLVSVRDPLARGAMREGEPELILDAFVDVEIEGLTIEDACVIDRELIREGDVVWVMSADDRLVTKDVTVAYRGRDEAWITAGLEDGDRVVVTNLTTPVDGMLLRVSDPVESDTDG
ncbi:MAG: efflux transporter periplasmic adaptor subunit [Phycisphaerae bacterium]|nr:efflux transporter periplasmic adaptor subunit [Phycisphaerae bacterium]